MQGGAERQDVVVEVVAGVVQHAAAFAAQRGIRIFTVGFGTEAGATIEAFGWSMRVQLDETALRGIAEITAGEYFRAADAAELGDVYELLKHQLLMEKVDREISSLCSNLAAILTLLAAALSFAWFGRVA